MLGILRNTSTTRPGNFNYVGNTGHPRNVLLPGDPANTGGLPPSTGIMSMSPMHLAAVDCNTAPQQVNNNLTVSLASITDGTSNTAAVSESLVNDGSGNSRRFHGAICTTQARV